MRSSRGRTLPSRGLSGSINLWALPVVFPRAGTRELFGDARWLFASSTRPSGKAVALRTGFNVSGRWSLVSGCELADWIAVMCVVFDGIEPRMPAKSVPETRMVYLPKGSYRIRDTWHVGGLRGTGSHDIVVDDVFVPAERTFSFTEGAQDDRPLSRMPFFASVCAGCAALCLGIAQAAIDTLLELGASKVQVDPFPATRDRPGVQVLVASSAAKLISARLLLYSALRDAWAACTQGATVTAAQRAHLWESGHHAAHASTDVVRSMYEAAPTLTVPLNGRTEIFTRFCSMSSLHHCGWRPRGRCDLALRPRTRFFKHRRQLTRRVGRRMRRIEDK